MGFNKNKRKHNYYIKYDRLSKTKTVIKLYRNNLSIKDFEKDADNRYILSEELNHKGCIVKISIIFKSDNFSMITTNCKSFKIKGTPNDFTIFSRTSISNFPMTVKGETPICIYNVRFDGTYNELKEDFELKRIRKKSKKRKYDVNKQRAIWRHTFWDIISVDIYNPAVHHLGRRISRICFS